MVIGFERKTMKKWEHDELVMVLHIWAIGLYFASIATSVASYFAGGILWPHILERPVCLVTTSYGILTIVIFLVPFILLTEAIMCWKMYKKEKNNFFKDNKCEE
jgi:hypothetical protein